MFLNSIDKKPLFKKPDGNVVRDLTQSIFDFKTRNDVVLNAFKVSRDYLMRPDLISQVVYNSTLYTEFILKYNGISNPFTIDEGDVIIIPNLESAKQNTKTVVGTEGDDPATNLRNSYRYIDPAKVPKKDKKIDKFENRNLGKKTKISEGALPPNIADEGVSQIVQRNGRVYFGESIGDSACLKNGMSSGEFLTKVIKSRKV